MNAATELLFPLPACEPRPSGQLLKWIGNKQRFAREILSYFPARFGTYFEPFLGSGAVLGTLAPERGEASDAFAPLIEIWTTLKEEPELVSHWYAERYALIARMGKTGAYAHVLSSYNRSPNGPDLLFLSRACYGGVVRFRKSDGYMSTPCGPHDPISPKKFSQRAHEWHRRIAGTTFKHCDYRLLMEQAQAGDVIYCDPPYFDSQSILYGAQAFRLNELYDAIAACKARGVFVALSIDGIKKSGKNIVNIQPPSGLFEKDLLIHCGRSMLKRFQMEGQSLESEVVADRLLLTG
jgi:DNA adenine methylase